MKVAIHTPTFEEYQELMQYLESKGYLWAGGNIPTSGYYLWHSLEHRTQVNIQGKKITYSGEMENAIPFSELKANNYQITINI